MKAPFLGMSFTVLSLVAVSCGDAEPTTVDSPTTPTSATVTTPTTSSEPANSTGTTSSTISPSTTTASMSSITSTSTTTSGARPECEIKDVLSTIDSAIASARLIPAGEWSTETAGNSFEDRTATGTEFADRLALDCGLLVRSKVGNHDRLAVATWTGPRMAWVIQTTEAPATPYAHDATVDVMIDSTKGQFLDGNQRSLWAGTLQNGETFVIGHVDYDLGAAAKGWIAGPRTSVHADVTLASEDHGIAALEAAGMRNIGVAQPSEIGSEEGYIQFVSPTGQISVADIGPTGWFDPLEPRYFSGPTHLTTINGVEVRVTEPNPDDNAGHTVGTEVGFACHSFVWLLEPPQNGNADEMLDTARAVISTEECHTD